MHSRALLLKRSMCGQWKAAPIGTKLPKSSLSCPQSSTRSVQLDWAIGQDREMSHLLPPKYLHPHAKGMRVNDYRRAAKRLNTPCEGWIAAENLFPPLSAGASLDDRAPHAYTRAGLVLQNSISLNLSFFQLNTFFLFQNSFPERKSTHLELLANMRP